MKRRAQAPDWATLRRIFGHPLPEYLPTMEKQMRPGHRRILYGQTATKRCALRPTTWKLGKELRVPEEVAKKLGKRPLLQLVDERDELLKEIFAHAYCGDEQAISLMSSTALGAVRGLEDLEKYQQAKLQTKAEASPVWPVLLSLNPQDIKQAKERIARLNVGTKALTPRRRGQRLDARNFWTVLADEALHECDNNK